MTKSLPPKSLVLYADDDADDLDMIREAFEEFSTMIELRTFNDGASLLHFVESLATLEPKPCLILLDINMAGLSGKQTLKRLRGNEAFTDVPVVLFTTSTLPAEAQFAAHYKAGFVTKPLHLRQIRSVVDQLIDHCTDEIKEKIRGQ